MYVTPIWSGISRQDNNIFHIDWKDQSREKFSRISKSETIITEILYCLLYTFLFREILWILLIQAHSLIRWNVKSPFTCTNETISSSIQLRQPLSPYQSHIPVSIKLYTHTQLIPPSSNDSPRAIFRAVYTTRTRVLLATYSQDDVYTR